MVVNPLLGNEQILSCIGFALLVFSKSVNNKLWPSVGPLLVCID